MALTDVWQLTGIQVQLQTLTAVVKLFLQKPDSSQGLVQRILNTATKDCDSPDVRDRAYIYWRLLSTDPGAAKAVVLAHRPPISLPRTTVSPQLLEELLGEISSLASVYHKPEETFVGQGRIGIDSVQRKGPDAELADERLATQKALQTVAAGQQAENLLDFADADGADAQPQGLAATSVLPTTPAAANLLSGTSSNPLDDLVSIFGSASMSAPTHPPGQPNFGFASPAPPSNLSNVPTSVMSPVQSPPAQDDLLGLF